MTTSRSELGYKPKLREAATAEFDRQWGEAIENAEALVQTFERLVAAMNTLAEQGVKMTVEMPTELTQAWWVAFRRRRGDYAPEGGLPLMQTEDELADDIVRGAY